MPFCHNQAREMKRSDLREVLEIEDACFEHPWAMSDFTRCFRANHVTVSVILWKTAIIGYHVIEQAGRTSEILNLAIAPKYQRRGVGTSVNTFLKGGCRSANCDLLVAYVSEDNLPGVKFFAACGFRATLERAYYKKTGRDAYRMEYRAVEVAANYKNRVENYYAR